MILKARRDCVAKRCSNAVEKGGDVGIWFKLCIPGCGIPQVKPPDLYKAVGVRIDGFRLAAGARFTREDSAAVGFAANCRWLLIG